MTRRDLFPLLLLCLAPFFFLSGTLYSDATFFARDLTFLFHPMHVFTAQALQARLPGENKPVWG
jgi:hypothetical protein